MKQDINAVPRRGFWWNLLAVITLLAIGPFAAVSFGISYIFRGAFELFGYIIIRTLFRRR